jgi:hypothetical protein
MDLLGAIGNLPGLKRADNGKDEDEETAE